MAKGRKKATKVATEEVKAEVIQPTKEVMEVPAEVHEYKEEHKAEPEADIYAPVQAIEEVPLPVIEVPEEDLQKFEPDTIDEFSVFAKAEESTDQVWVKDPSLIKKILGRKYTLSGTLYLGILREL